MFSYSNNGTGKSTNKYDNYWIGFKNLDDHEEYLISGDVYQTTQQYVPENSTLRDNYSYAFVMWL